MAFDDETVWDCQSKYVYMNRSYYTVQKRCLSHKRTENAGKRKNDTGKDKVRNESTRKTTEYDIMAITTQKGQLRWFGHAQRMEDSRRAKQALHWILDEKKSRSIAHYEQDMIWR